MKKLILTLFAAAFGILSTQAQFYNIKTVAGDSNAGYYGDGGQATAAELNAPYGVALDHAGNIYIADYNNYVVRKVSTSGVISTIAGNGTNGFYGDGGQATAAEIKLPTGVASDAAGNIYIADLFNGRIRKVATNGVITTYAGNGSTGFYGDGGQATAAEFDNPAAVTLDASGNLYVGDFYNYRIRKITTGGIISTVAGNGSYGYNGDGIQATAAKLSDAVGVAVDASGNIYIADEINNRIRKVNTSGVISTFAGNGVSGYAGDGAAATLAEVAYPYDVTTDASGNVFIADYGNSVVRMVNSSGNITTIAGNGTRSYYGDGGPAGLAELNEPNRLVLDSAGNIFINDNGNNRIRELTPVVNGINNISQNESVRIYPNPGSGKYTIQLPLSDQRSIIEVYTILGEKVFSSNLAGSIQKGETETQIDLGNQSKGIYLYRIITQTGTEVSSGKLIIE